MHYSSRASHKFSVNKCKVFQLEHEIKVIKKNMDSLHVPSRETFTGVSVEITERTYTIRQLVNRLF